MNRPIRFVAVFAAMMTFALLLNVTYSAAFGQSGLNKYPKNTRVRDAEFSQNRGDILVGGTAVARTVATDGQYKYLRTYPKGAEFAPITGYYSYYFGRTALEYSQNAQLTGTSDSQFLQRVTGTLSGRKPQGGSVITTINGRAQNAAWNGLAGKKGGVVAIDYTTGAILAMATSPSYDPNLLASHDLPATQKAWKSLNANSSLPMANRASKEIYPPGSTFKLVTASAALESGRYTPDGQVDTPSSIVLPQTTNRLGNEVDCGNGTVSLTEALDNSCNTAFAKIGMSLGQNALREQAKKYGFDSSIDSDVPVVPSLFPGDMNEAQVALSSIGQYDVAASPLQMAMVASGIANDGKLMTPYLTQSVRASNLQTVWRHHNTTLSHPTSRSTAESLQKMMVSVVENGTGGAAKIDGLTIGGKTGTAQTTKDASPYAWFVGFSENPHVAVAVFIESSDTERSEIAGGTLAGPIARSVIQAVR
ncbi:MAG: penicillin-binding protein 2 [Acidipropionibacterium jensenii]|nr:penicillin-binding protein 2 [Acidipropionibacterium jensenii]